MNSVDTFKSPLYTDEPRLSIGNVTFVEASIKDYGAILGILWLQIVNPYIDWQAKSIRPRSSSNKTSINSI